MSHQSPSNRIVHVTDPSSLRDVYPMITTYLPGAVRVPCCTEEDFPPHEFEPIGGRWYIPAHCDSFTWKRYGLLLYAHKKTRELWVLDTYTHLAVHLPCAIKSVIHMAPKVHSYADLTSFLQKLIETNQHPLPCTQTTH